MLVTLSGIVTLVRLVQSANAEAPMLVTLSGIVTLVRLCAVRERTVPDAGDAVRDRDAGQADAVTGTPRSPMLVTLLPIVTLVRLVQ